MDTIRLTLEGSCNGAKPVDYDIDELTNEEWYAPLLHLILEEDCEAAEELAKEWLNAEFLLENLERLEELGFRYVETLSTFARDPFVEEVDGVKIPLFRWIGAEFLVDAPIDVVNEWISQDGTGRFILDDDELTEWLETNDCSLQDGCIYRIGSICYDLEGFGENGCSIDRDRLEEEINSQRQPLSGKEESGIGKVTKLTGDQLLAKIKEMEGAPQGDIVRACGYILIDKRGNIKLDNSSFFNAHMKAKGVFS